MQHRMLLISEKWNINTALVSIAYYIAIQEAKVLSRTVSAALAPYRALVQPDPDRGELPVRAACLHLQLTTGAN